MHGVEYVQSNSFWYDGFLTKSFISYSALCVRNSDFVLIILSNLCFQEMVRKNSFNCLWLFRARQFRGAAHDTFLWAQS